MARYRVGLETRARILASTRELLGELGLDGVTLKAITDHAGVGAGSFYNLFDTKEAAVLTVVREAIAAVDPDPERRGADTVEELVAAFVAFFERDPTMARIYLTIAISRGLVDERLNARVMRHHRRRVERFADALQREFAALDGATAAQEAETMIATLTGYAIRTLMDPTFDLSAHASKLATSAVSSSTASNSTASNSTASSSTASNSTASNSTASSRAAPAGEAGQA